MRILLYDDFNHIVQAPNIIGTIRQTFSRLAFANGVKIIEIHDSIMKDNENGIRDIADER